VRHALAYLLSRDVDGDHLLEQGANQDWADVLLRRGKVTYTQAVWFACLEAAESMFMTLGDEAASTFWRNERALVRQAIMDRLRSADGYYVNYRDEEDVSLRRSLDTALLVAFGVVEGEAADAALRALSSLSGPFGPAVIEPGYAAADIGPSKYPPGQYHNEGIWPWIASYLALAWAKAGRFDEARQIVSAVLAPNPDTVHEWIDNVTGEPHHPDFATGAGALAWALTEGGLAGGVPAVSAQAE
jgi:glycogen debranching enzyme